MGTEASTSCEAPGPGGEPGAAPLPPGAGEPRCDTPADPEDAPRTAGGLTGGGRSEPDEPVPGEGASRVCLSCGTELRGAFCHACGQKDQPRRVPFRHLLLDVVHDLWHFDRKVLRTLWLLVSRPGFLTAEYLAGRRAPYVPPFRLYVVTSFVVFLALSMVPSRQRVDLHFQSDAGAPSSSEPATEAATGAPEAEPQPLQVATDTDSPALPETSERVKHTFVTNLSRSLFLLMPLLAALLHLLHARRGHTYFVDHMVLSLHLHTFSFLVVLALVGLHALPGEDWGELPGLALLLVPPAHLAVSLQRLYARGWLRSSLKAAIVSVSYGMVLAITMIGLFLLSAARAGAP